MIRLSPTEARKLGLPADGEGRSKYGARRCDCGRKHASQRECRRAAELEAMQRAGLIRNLREQVTYILAESVVLDGRKKPALRYVADFVYEKLLDAHEPAAQIVPGYHIMVGSGWQQVVEDVKSAATRANRAYRIKRHLMLSELGIEVKEV